MTGVLESKSLLPSSKISVSRAFPSGRILRILLWVLIPIVLWWAIKDVPLSQITEKLAYLSFPKIIGLFVLNGLIITLFSSRWWVILRAQGYPRLYSRLVLYRLAAFSMSYFTPGPQFGGEPLQVFLLKKREKVPFASAVASVTLDKLFELLANFTFLLIGMATVILAGVLEAKPSPMLLSLPAGLLIIPLGYLIALGLGFRPASTLFSALAKRFETSSRLREISLALDSAEMEIAGFYREKPAALVLSGSLSILIWLIMVYEFHLALRWLGAPLTLPQTVTALTASRLAFLLPLPSGLGTLEASQVLVMERLGINPAIGISLSLVIRARDLVFAGIGLLFGILLTRWDPELKSWSNG